MEFVEGAAEDEGIRTKDKERPRGSKPEPAASPRLPGPRPPLPPPEFYIPGQLLPRALSALQGEDLAQFRRKLYRFSPSLRVSQAQVEAAGVAELRDLLLCNYSWSDALQKVVQALEKTTWQRQGEWHGTEELWISSCLGYALEGLDGDDLERFKRKLCSPLRLSVTFVEQELEIIKDVPQLCRLMLTKRGWLGSLLLSAAILEGINRKDEAGWLRVVEKRSHGPPKVLQHALQTLERGDLQKFKKSLLHFREQQDSDSAFKGLAEGERRVKLFEDLEPVDAGELSKSLISSYGSFEALEMAADVLETINQKRLAGWLRLCLAAPDPWECLEDTLVSLGKKELQELKHDFFPSRLFLTVNWATVEAADVSKLCHLLRNFCGDFVALDVASEILEAIGQKHQADWLRLGMVGFNLQKCLDCVLQHLGQEKWERFKDKLHDHWREMGCDPLPTWTGYRTKTLMFFDLLTQSDVSQLGSKLIKFYGVKDVLEVVTKVLDAMNEKSEADWLRMWMEEQNAWRHLKDAFSNLGEENLEKFRCKVLQLSDNKGLPSVPKIWMKGTTIPQFIKVIFSFYGQGAALEMVGEALKTIADRVSSSIMTDLYQYLVQIYGSVVSPLESLVSEEEMSGKMKSPADLGKNCVCKRCPSQTLREPDIFWNSQRKREIYRLRCTKAGSFCCCYTGLIFDVTKAVTIQYWSDSWKKWQYLWNTQDLTIAGSLFYLDELPLDAVSAIHFPHFLCLEGEDTSQVQIASFLPKGIHLEKPSSVGPFHAVLRNPRFSFFGVVFRKSCFNQKIKAHAMVLLYHIHDPSQFKFHVYLLPNDYSVRKSVHDREMKHPSCRVEKPSWTSKPLTINSPYFLQEFSDISILPKELEFKYLDPELEPQYFELYTLQMPDTLQLKVMEKTKDEPVWEAHVSQDELMPLPLHSVQDVLSRLQKNVYDEVLQLEPAVPSGKEMSKENPTEFQEDCICYMSHSESLTEPDVFWNKQMGHEVYKLHCTKAGSFHCCYTGLIFEVKAAVTIKYWPCSWKKWQNLLNPLSLIIAGPLLYLETCPSNNVTAIHFPHFLCLTDEDSSQVLIARFTSGDMYLLKPDCMKPFHAVLRNPAWYNYGVVVRKSLFNQGIKAHGMVLLYQVLDTSSSKFHLYLLPKDYTLRQSVHDREVEHHSWRVKKPLRTLKPLKIGSWYILQELAGVFISPKELNFKYVNLELEQQYIELYTEQTPDTLVLKMMEKDKDAPVWEACVGQDELMPPLHSEKGLKQNPVQILGDAVPQLWSPVPLEKKRSGKMENPAGLGENFICNKCPDENLPEKKRPEVVWHPESNQEMYKLSFTTAGSFHCCYTELIFEVRGAATITYQFGSWKKHLSAKDVQNLMIAGPLLNIQADPMDAVAAIHFPHFLCLAGEDKSHLYVAHFLDEGMSLERPDCVGPFHAVLKDPTFSLFGTILQILGLKQNIMVHAVVLLYQVLEIAVPKFHLYLLPRDSHLMMTVDKYEEKCLSRRLQKPPRVSRPLRIGSRFLMVNIDGVTVCPEDLELEEVDAELEQQYLELYAPHIEGQLEVNVVEKESNESVWKTYVRCEELRLPYLHPAPDLRLSVPSQLHFIQRHRAELIQRTASIEAILDMLVNIVIDGEHYANISSKPTNQEKMRELYKLVPSWNDNCKDLLYNALKRTNRFLIDELEESER